MRLAVKPLILILAALALLTACVDRGGGESAATTETAAVATSPDTQAKPAGAASTPASWTGDAVNFSFTTGDGEQRTADSYAGKPLVLNFWAAW